MSDLDCVEAYEEIGDNFLSLKSSKSPTRFTRAVQLDPQSANANYLLGFTYSSLGEWDFQLIIWKVPTKFSPITRKFCDVWVGLIFIMVRRKRELSFWRGRLIWLG